MRRALLSICIFGACTSEPGFEYDAVPDEPELTSEELATLPDGLEIEHHADLETALASEIAEDDAAMFDDDETITIVDEPVTEDGDEAAFQPLLRSGLHPRASDGLRAAGVSAWRITQTIGNAPASAGVHARDGYANGKPYTAAVDISVSGLSTTQIRNLIERLAKQGFAVWYRQGGRDGWNGANHLHGVYANSKMKSALRSQVRSWMAGRNGLVSNTIYRFHTFSASARATVKGKFAMSSQGTSNGGAGVSGRVNTSGTALTVRARPTRDSAVVGSLADGTYFTIGCQQSGQSVSGTYGTSTLWDRVGGGYVSDAYVSTGSDGRVAPSCN
jgi:hypothetical protein